MSVIDVCLFAGEREMLELRFRTLRDVVDRFVVVACARTHQGQPVNRDPVEAAFVAAGEAAGPLMGCMQWVVPSNIMERHGRVFERPADARGEAGTAWFQHIEKQHRDGMKAAVEHLAPAPEDCILMSDVDEIPTPEAVTEAAAYLARESAWLVFAQRFHSGSMNLLHPQQPWFGTCAARYVAMHPQAHRDARTTIGTPNQNVSVIGHGGWHFSWFGTDADRAAKLDTFSHAELRGKFDPADGRRAGYHANGERLIFISSLDSEVLDWPAPLVSTFDAPPYWYSENPDA